MLFKLFFSLTCVLGLFFTGTSRADIGIAPYLSISEKKSIKTNRETGVEEQEIIQKQEYGLKGYVSFWKIFKLQLSVGTSEVTTTQSELELVDDYGEIDFASDADLSGQTAGIDTSLLETQNKGKLSFVLDPSFSIFLTRAYFGVTATQRIVEVKQEGVTLDKVEPEPTYKPHMGFGLGVKLSRKMYAMAEYEFYLYSFPEVSPFERSVSISYGISI